MFWGECFAKSCYIKNGKMKQRLVYNIWNWLKKLNINISSIFFSLYLVIYELGSKIEYT